MEGAVVASYIDASRLLCKAPSALAAGAALVLDADFNSLGEFALPVTNWYHRPMILDAGFIQLTSADFLQKGSALVYSPLDPLAFLNFDATFFLRITTPHGHAGESLSFCAGDLASPVPSHGLLNAICVTVVMQPTLSAVRLEHKGLLIAESPVPHAVDKWLRLDVTLADRNASVLYDGHSVLDRIHCAGWDPSEGLEVGFSARTGQERASRHWVDGVRITAGAFVVGVAADVEVSLNGYEFTDSGVSFEYLSEPHLRSSVPASGPVIGATLLALEVKAPSAFVRADRLRCNFVGVRVNATWHSSLRAVLCHTPPSLSAHRVMVTVEMAVDGHELHAGDGVLYEYYPPLVLDRVLPNSGPTDGATEIALEGDSFGFGAGPFACRFGTDVVKATVELRSRTLRCKTPPSTQRTVSVEVTVNGQQYHGGVLGGSTSFHFYSPPRLLSISPASGTVHGLTVVTVTGFGFQYAFNGLCRWDTLTTQATALNSTHLICPSPRAEVGLKTLEIALNGQQFSSSGLKFSQYLHPSIHQLGVPGSVGELGSWLENKVVLPRAGYVMVRVWGSGFMGGTDYRCRLNDANTPITAIYDKAMDAILCWSNEWLDGINHVEVTLNGREYTSDGAFLEINQFW